MSQIKDALGAVSLVFTVLTFFVSRRFDNFDAEELDAIGVASGLQALLDLVLAGVAILVLVIVWPLLDQGGAFGGFSKPDDVLPNLLAVIAAGFAVLALIEAGMGLIRLVGGIVLKIKE